MEAPDLGGNHHQGPVLIEAYEDEIEERMPTPPPPSQPDQEHISEPREERLVELDNDSSLPSLSERSTACEGTDLPADESSQLQGQAAVAGSSSLTAAGSSSTTVAGSSSTTVAGSSSTAVKDSLLTSSCASLSQSSAATALTEPAARKRTLPPLTRQEHPKKCKITDSMVGCSGLVKNPFDPRPILMVKRPKTMVDHTYRDYAQVPLEDCDGDRLPCTDTESSFPVKLHCILAKDEYAGIIGWMSHGRAFRVDSPKRFESKVAPHFFSHSRYSSFLRDLNKYGFKHLTVGDDRNCYYHEAFLRGLPHLCKYMPRPKKNPRRLLADPENEPNFYIISQSFPLPDTPAGSSKRSFEEKTISKLSTEEMVSSAKVTGKARKRDNEPLASELAPASKRLRLETQSRREPQVAQAGFELPNFGMAAQCEPHTSSALSSHSAMMFSAAMTGTLGYTCLTAQQALHLAGPSIDPLTLQLLQNLANAQMRQFPFLDSRR